MAAACLCLSGCGEEPTPSPSIEDDTAIAAAQQLQTQKDCMARVVDNTIAKAQPFAQAEAAFDQQNLVGCPRDFVASFVALKNSLRLYLQSERELAAHRGRQEDAVKSDLLDAGRQIIFGGEAGRSAIDDWQSGGSELERRVSEQRYEMKRRAAALETLIAGYGLYIQDKEPAAARGTDLMTELNSAAEPANTN